MEKQFKSDPTVEVSQSDLLPFAIIAQYLQEQLPDLGKLKEIRRFPGGFSNLTYLLRTDEGQFVLRRPPKGAAIKTAHDMGREYRILSALYPHYPKIPKPLHSCDDPSVIGVSFYIMQKVEGLILRGATPPSSTLPWSKMAETLIHNLADLHSILEKTTGLEGLGKPEGYIARQVEGWTRRYQRAQTDPIGEMDLIAEWLDQNQPEDHRAALIHNDYKYDNLIFNPEEPSQLLAVLDWEMATIGHPLMDLGTTLAYWAEEHDPPILKQFNPSWQPGNPDRQELAVAYFSHLGESTPDLMFYYLFGLFKVSVICQQIYYRFQKGHSTDQRFAALIHVVKACSQMGVGALEQGRIHHLASKK
jgi:aminoglycoside phosphotransferase (APT) family kinase protein